MKKIFTAISSIGIVTVGIILSINKKKVPTQFVNKVIEIEKTFEGISQNEINTLAQATQRGVKAVINGDILEYSYSSKSGKTIKMIEIAVDSTGKLIAYLGNGSYFNSNSPRFFVYSLQKLIKSNNI